MRLSAPARSPIPAAEIIAFANHSQVQSKGAAVEIAASSWRCRRTGSHPGSHPGHLEGGGMEQLGNGHEAIRQPLLVVLLQEVLEAAAVGVDAVGPEIRAHQGLCLVKLL